MLKYEEKKTPFKRWNIKYKCEPKEHKDTMLKRSGKYIKLQDYINENNKDCTIYQVLNTYRGDLKLTQDRLNTITHRVADELQEIDGLRDALTIMNTAKRTWNEMPLEIRKEFKNDVHNFQVNGLAWAKAKQEEIKKLQESAKVEVKESEVTNG